MSSAGHGAQQVRWDTVQLLVLPWEVQVVRAMNKEEKLREVEQRSRTVTTGGRTQGLSPSYPVRTIQDEAQRPVWLPRSV